MQKVFHPAKERGHANYGWLDANYSFSFANYYNPEKMGFGRLLVMNQDTIAPASGFETHSHKNMEIVTIVLSGTLEHKDSLGSVGQITPGEVQVMSAGTGVSHSEKNPSLDQATHLLQIWVLPEKNNVPPRYDQKDFSKNQKQNQMQTLVSFDERNGSMFLHQNALFEIGTFQQGKSILVELESPKHGVYIFVIDGKALIGENVLSKSDAMGIWDTSEVSIEIQEDCQILTIQVPVVE